ncbi:MAG: hypothetical protein ACI4PH_07245 [Faecousia sp.]
MRITMVHRLSETLRLLSAPSWRPWSVGEMLRVFEAVEEMERVRK